MPRVVPSQVVELIDQIFPNVKENPSSNFSINREHANIAAAIIELIDHIPSELFVLPTEQYIAIVSAVASLKSTIEVWKLREYGLDKTPGFGKRNPVLLIRDSLSKCPDEFPSPETANLVFIQDDELRKNLEIDISATNQALSNNEWKAATVLAGSVIEALLLWALKQKRQSEVREAIKRLNSEKILN